MAARLSIATALLASIAFAHSPGHAHIHAHQKLHDRHHHNHHNQHHIERREVYTDVEIVTLVTTVYVYAGGETGAGSTSSTSTPSLPPLPTPTPSSTGNSTPAFSAPPRNQILYEEPDPQTSPEPSASLNYISSFSDPTSAAKSTAYAVPTVSNDNPHSVPTPTGDLPGFIRKDQPRSLTVTVLNKEAAPIVMAQEHDANLNVKAILGPPPGTPATINPGEDVVVVYPRDYSGNIAIAFAKNGIHGKESLIEVSLKDQSPRRKKRVASTKRESLWLEDIDVSYANAYTNPIVCKCKPILSQLPPGAYPFQKYASGCIADLFHLGNQCPNANSQLPGSCVNPIVRDLAMDAEIEPFFLPCKALAYVIPRDPANSNGECPSADWECCVGATCDPGVGYSARAADIRSNPIKYEAVI